MERVLKDDDKIGKKDFTRIELWVKRTTIIANVVIFLQVIAIIVAVCGYRSAEKNNNLQIETSQKHEFTKNAIEVVNKIYNSEFLLSYGKLSHAIKIDNEELKSAFILVLNTYNLVAIVYNSKIADTILIMKSIKNGIMGFVGSKIYQISYPGDVNVQSAKDAINQMIQYWPKRSKDL